MALDFDKLAAGAEEIDKLAKQTRQRSSTPSPFLTIFERALEMPEGKGILLPAVSAVPANADEDSELAELQKSLSKVAGQFKRQNEWKGKIKTSVTRVPEPDGKTGRVQITAVWEEKYDNAKPVDKGESVPSSTPDVKADAKSATNGSTDKPAAKPTAPRLREASK